MKIGFTKTLGMPLVAAFAFAAFPALAADLNAGYKNAPVYAAPSNWTGFYLGVNGGYGWGARSSTLDTQAIDSDLVPAVIGAASSTFSNEGGFGGGQLGYNVQRDRIVFGVEADIQGANIAGKAFSEANADGEVITDAWANSNLDWFGTFRGRLGYSFGGTLVYATGGLAFGGVRDSLTQTVTSQNTTPLPTTVSDSASRNTTLTGYVVGGGFETALTPSWSVKAEYQYIDLGSTSLSTTHDIPYPQAHVDSGSASVAIDHTYHTARVGLNYKLSPVYEPLK